LLVYQCYSGEIHLLKAIFGLPHASSFSQPLSQGYYTISIEPKSKVAFSFLLVSSIVW